MSKTQLKIKQKEDFQKIEIYPVKNIKVSKIHDDPDNPNIMNPDEMQALKESMKFNGLFQYPVIDKKGVICDGFHRVQVFRELGLKEVPCIIANPKNDYERRLIRQAANKVRGHHDPEKDLYELERLMEYNRGQVFQILQVDDNKLNDMKELIAINNAATVKAIDEMSQVRTMDGDPLSHHANTFLFGNIKQITAYFDNKHYQEAVNKSQDLMKLLGIGNHTDLFWNLLLYAHKNQKLIKKSMKVVKLKAPPKQKMEYKYDA